MSALCRFLVTDGQNTCDHITRCRRSKPAWSNCILCIPFILNGSPNKCCPHTCNACIITTWRLGLRAPLVAHNNKHNNSTSELLFATDYTYMLYTYSMHYVNTSVFAVTQTTYCPRSFLLQNLNFLQVAFSFLIPFNILLKTLILLLKLFKMFFVVSKRNLKRSRKVNNRTE